MASPSDIVVASGSTGRSLHRTCIHKLKKCWCTVRFGEAGLINGQAVEFRGEKILTFPARRGIMRVPPTPPFKMWGPMPAFDGRKRR